MTGTALVTGASSGIGAAVVRRLRLDGWQVVASARRRDRLDEVAGGDPEVHVAVADVTDDASVAGLAAGLVSCDLLVCNAGGAFDLDAVAEADLEAWRRTYDLNVLGVVRVVRAVLPLLRRSRAPQIVVTGSTAGRWTYPGGGSYVASKHAVAAVRDTLRLELVEDGIRVCEVAPGMVATEEFSLVRFDGDTERAAAVYAGVDALTAEDVADVVAWVAARPAHVNVDLVQLTPQQQAAAHRVHRRTESS